MKTLALCCLLILAGFVNLGAQKAFEWAEYGLAFDLADDFQETVNTGEEFSAKGDGMSVSIFPFQDETIDDADITARNVGISFGDE